MPTWPRTICPTQVSFPRFPGGLDSWGESGKGQVRSIMAVGRVWEEVYSPIRMDQEDTKEFIALINQYWRNRTVVEVDHRYFQTQMGAGGGTPLVNGASQTGSSLDTDGWPASTSGVLKAGDIIKVAGIPYILDVTADADSDSGGNATLSISPPIFSGGSPADDAVITYTGVKYKCVIAEPPNIPRGARFVAGLRIVFREVISV